jgi:hypothetical protein
MKHTFYRDGKVRKTVMRDAHAPETIAVKVETDETEVLKRNQQIRNAELMRQSDRFTLVDEQAEVVVGFQFPTVADYNLARLAYPDLFEALQEGGRAAERAGEQLALLMPQYVTTVIRGDARRRSRPDVR